MATIKDIAKITGFSTMTISRYFNNPEKVKEKTREKIKEAVEQLDYSPNLVARLLVTKRTNIICVYIAGDLGIRHPFTLESIAGIAETLGKYGYSMHVCRDSYEGRTYDGIISMDTSIEEEEELMELSSEKVIVMFGNSSQRNNWIDINNYQGMFDMAEFVCSRGYKKIGYVGTQKRMRYSHDRYNGFVDGLKKNGVILEDKNTVHVGHNDQETGYYAAKAIIENGDAEIICCATDEMAIGVYQYANEHGLNIPEDLAVTGYDGLGYETLVTPHITTMKQPVFEAGCKIAERVVEILASNSYGDKTAIYINPILLEGGSTK